MKKRLFFILLLVLVSVNMFPQIVFMNPLIKTDSRLFSTILVGEEYAQNRDGYMLKVSDHIAVMKLYNDLDEVLWIDNPKNDGLNGELILKAEIIDYHQESYGLSLLVDNGEQLDLYDLFLNDSSPAEIGEPYLLVKIDHHSSVDSIQQGSSKLIVM